MKKKQTTHRIPPLHAVTGVPYDQFLILAARGSKQQFVREQTRIAINNWRRNRGNN